MAKTPGHFNGHGNSSGVRDPQKWEDAYAMTLCILRKFWVCAQGTNAKWPDHPPRFFSVANFSLREKYQLTNNRPKSLKILSQIKPVLYQTLPH
jgi:hypothetical protein